LPGVPQFEALALTENKREKMSFVIAAPELIEAAAHDLSGIGSTLGEATNFAAAPTTSIAAAGADEVSVAIAALFGSHGQEFQALSAQAAAFHDEFVGLMKSGAGAYVRSEVANAEQMLGGALHAPAEALGAGVAGAPAHVEGAASSVGQSLGGLTEKVGSAVTALENGGGASLLSGRIATGAQAISRSVTGLQSEVAAFGATVAAPYQTLFSNTAANLQGIGNTFAANPFPFVHQVINNQIDYAQTIATSLESGSHDFAALPGHIQTDFREFLSANPEALIQHSINNQIGYAHTIATSLQSAAHDIGTGAHALPAVFQNALQEFSAGNLSGAGHTLGQGLENFLLPGFQEVVDNPGANSLIPIPMLGALGDLAPIFAIPGQMAQNFTNLLPAGSIAAQMAQHTTNLVNAFTDFGASLDQAVFPPGILFGLPLQFLFGVIGAPVNGLVALHSSAAALISAVQTGNMAGAAAVVLDAPAVLANGVLNGQTMLTLPPLTVNLGGVWPFPSTASIPLGGLLTPLSPMIDNQLGPLTGSTYIGGLIPELESFGAELARDI
jgi:hypothetical protein